MKLMELLEQGKKATREGFESCIIADGDKIKLMDIETNEFFDCKLSLLDLTRNDWYEYEEYKTNFEFKENDIVYNVYSDGIIADKYFTFSREVCKNRLENFNAFPNKELAEFIQKKQLLERKLIVFSYLNGASEIDWHNDEVKYYIDASIDEGEFSINNDYIAWYQSFNDIFFKDRETCEKAIELYENEIKEVMEMKKKLGL